MADYQVVFTPSDARSTATDELTWQIRTATGTGGTLLLSGTATANTEKTTATITDNELVHGSNTRYLRIVDGAGNISNPSFTVEAEFAFPVELTVDSAGTSTVTTGLSAAPRIAAAISGTSSASIALTAAIPIVVESSGASTVDARVQVQTYFSATIAGSSSVDARLIPAAFIPVDAYGWSTTSINLTAVPSFEPTVAGQSTMNAGLQAQTFLSADIAGTSTIDINLVIIPYIEAEIAAQSSAQVTLTSNKPIAVNIAGRSDMQVSLLQLVPVVGYKLRADIYSPSGVRLGAGPLVQILAAEYGETLDGVGTFSLEIPAIDPMAAYVVSGNEIRLYRDGEGLVFRGLIDSRETLIDAAGKLTLAVSGDSIARQLVWANTLLGREFSNVTMSSAVNTLLSGTGWMASSVQSDTRNLTAQYDGASVWQALAHAAELFGWHVRERNLNRQIDIGPMGASSGLVFQNVEHISEDMGVLPLTRLRLGETQDELWNRVVPVGGGDGVNALTLRYATRTSPYTKQTAAGPDGRAYWFIENSASIAEHGLRVKVLSVKDIVPISNSVAEIQNAANTLYDVAAAWLGWHSEVQESYQAETVGLKHVVDGQPRFRTGDTVRLVYRGAVVDEGGRRLWRSVDRDVYVMGYTRRFNPDGSDMWSFNVSTTDRETPSDADAVARALEDLWAIKTAKRPYTYREIHGPFVESIAAGDDARFLVDFDSSVTYLHKATLRVRKRRVKSNVSAAASGGGQTSSSGGGQTTTSGGGQTSSSDGSHSHGVSSDTTPSGGGHTSGSGDNHSHSVSGGAANSGGTHRHPIGQAQTVQSWFTPSHSQQIILNSGTGTYNYGFYVGRNGTSPGATVFFTDYSTDHTHSVSGIAAGSEGTHKHSVLNHTHTVSGQTALSSGSHSHSVSNHTHSVSNHTHTVSDHTHALIYGIYLGPTASTPQMRVIINGTDRTAALGGPWNSDFLVDVTVYLTDAQGHVLRQANNIDIESSQLMDAEVVVKSLVTSTSVVPV